MWPYFIMKAAQLEDIFGDSLFEIDSNLCPFSKHRLQWEIKSECLGFSVFDGWH